MSTPASESRTGTPLTSAAIIKDYPPYPGEEMVPAFVCANIETRSGELERLLRRLEPWIGHAPACMLQSHGCTCKRPAIIAEIQAALGQGEKY